MYNHVQSFAIIYNHMQSNHIPSNTCALRTEKTHWEYLHCTLGCKNIALWIFRNSPACTRVVEDSGTLNEECHPAQSQDIFPRRITRNKKQTKKCCQTGLLQVWLDFSDSNGCQGETCTQQTTSVEFLPWLPSSLFLTLLILPPRLSSWVRST